MFLIIPVIELAGGQAVRQVRGVEGAVYPTDPAALARIWRKENAKVLHLTDKDSLLGGALANYESIVDVVHAVDIPIEVGGGFVSADDVERLLAAGVYRVVLDVVKQHDRTVLERLVTEFLPQRIVAGFRASHGAVLGAEETVWPADPIELGRTLQGLGCSRVVYRNVEARSGELVLEREPLRAFARATGLRVTTAGGIRNVQDLWAVQELESNGVDSILLGKSLYENRFPCQKLWRLVEADELMRKQ